MRDSGKEPAIPEKPAIPAPIEPVPQSLSPHGYCSLCSGDGLEFPKPAGCGAGEKNADTRPAPTRAHPYLSTLKSQHWS
jgi:hypothetical protein